MIQFIKKKKNIRVNVFVLNNEVNIDLFTYVTPIFQM